MKVITEDYCSYEVATLLKEKGFEGDINAYYHIWDYGNKVCSVQEFSHSEAPHLYVPAPTHQMAMKWLRVEDIDIIIMPLFKLKRGRIYCYEIHSDNTDVRDGQFETYEEAVEAALKYSLENLI